MTCSADLCQQLWSALRGDEPPVGDSTGLAAGSVLMLLGTALVCFAVLLDVDRAGGRLLRPALLVPVAAAFMIAGALLVR